jgi:hypothetical protein
MKTIILAICIAGVMLAGCMENPPSATDGNATLSIVAIWDSSSVDSVSRFSPLTNAKVIITSEYGTMIQQTDAYGVLRLEKLPSTTYTVSVRKVHPMDPNIQLVGNMLGIVLRSGSASRDTIRAKAMSSSGISINEIYCAGPVNSFFFFYDQFIELYNASDSVRYLDGMFVMRVSGNSELNIKPGEDFGNDGDMDGVTYAFRFPGVPGEHNHPINPGQFKVLASDAVNHSTLISTAVDLSHADWEFYNQYSPEDIDNPAVPNLINIRSDRTTDFLINLSADVIVVSGGRDSNWVDGINISDVVDGVEYQSNPPPSSEKTLDNRIDRGYVLSPAKYSGKSMQRREPGSDSNDGTLDFETLNRTTPGRQ